MRKREQARTLIFFVGSNLLVHWVKNPLWGVQSLELVNFCPLHLRGSCSADVFTFLRLAVDSRKENRYLLTSACCVARNFRSHREFEQDLGPPVFLNQFWPCYLVTIIWFIYLFIYLFIQFSMSRQIRYIATTSTARRLHPLWSPPSLRWPIVSIDLCIFLIYCCFLYGVLH